MCKWNVNVTFLATGFWCDHMRWETLQQWPVATVNSAAVTEAFVLVLSSWTTDYIRERHWPKERYKKSERKRYWGIEWEGNQIGSVRCECSTPVKQQGSAKHAHLPPAHASITTIQMQNLQELNQRCNTFQENMSDLKQHAGLSWTTKIQASHCCFN